MRPSILQKILFLLATLSFLSVPKANDKTITMIDLLSSDMGLKAISQQLNLKKLARPKNVTNEIIEQTENYEFRRLQLDFGKLGTARLWLRQPKNLQTSTPLIFVMSGVQSSYKTLKLFPLRENLTIAVYDYISKIEPKESKNSKLELKNEPKSYQLAGDLIEDLPFLQARIAASLAWLSRQPTVQSDRITTAMVSFGSFVGPLALRLAALLMPAPVYGNVFAFGGADLASLALPKIEDKLSDKDFRKTEKILRSSLDILDPIHHLPSLSGRFLIINGKFDHVISKESSAALVSAIQGPKIIVELQTDHINTDKYEIISMTIAEIEKWMVEVGAVN